MKKFSVNNTAVKTAFFTISDSPGGAEQLLQQVALYKKADTEVTVFIFKSRETNFWSNKDLNVVYLNRSFIELFKQMNKYQFYLVMSSHVVLNAILGFSRSIHLLQTKYLVCRESTNIFKRFSKLKLLQYKLCYRFGYRNIDLLITQTDEMKLELLLARPFLSNRMSIKTIPNIFNPPVMEVEKLNSRVPFIAAAGRLIPEKGFDLLIKSFAKLKKDYKNLKLLILGEGPQRNELQILIDKLELSMDVELKGFVNDVYPYFKTAEACVVSSRIEGFPNVLLQMMSQNTKVVSTRCAGGIKDLKGVLTCAAGDVQELYKAMNTILNPSCDCRQNRTLFDEELKLRSPQSFVSTLKEFLL